MILKLKIILSPLHPLILSQRSRLILFAFLLIPLVLALFPFGWLGIVLPSFGSWLDSFFFNDWIHALGHGTIFCLLGLALLIAFPKLRSRLLIFYALILVAAVEQEFFQLLYKQHLFVFDDSRDIFTDLIGAALALLLIRYLLPRVIPAPNSSAVSKSSQSHD